MDGVIYREPRRSLTLKLNMLWHPTRFIKEIIDFFSMTTPEGFIKKKEVKKDGKRDEEGLGQSNEVQEKNTEET